MMCNDCSNKKMSIVSIFKPCEGFPLQCWKENGLRDTDVGFVCEQKIERTHNAVIVWPAGQIQPTKCYLWPATIQTFLRINFCLCVYTVSM